ncbi:hypothetical protein QYE76_005131 [Lolium multiflorum]|uniref:Cystatin domain-containing protein n=1 Tax=Lolium multiflorum TaxID=4521 RepID=A0AAD8RS11_LOLMU|nr:hypothetical protein QYE76_005131 [Lolium multiflorum]
MSVPASLTGAVGAPRRSRLAVVVRAVRCHEQGGQESSRRAVVFGAAAVVTALTAAVSRPARAEAMAGGYVEMVVDDHVRDLGEWAVRQHNKESGEKDDVQFDKVVKAEGQVVNGMNYNLFIDCKDSRGTPGTYLAEVYEKVNRPGVQETLKLNEFVRLLKSS